MTRYSIILLTLIFLSCNSSNSSNNNTYESNPETEKTEITEILLTETKLGDLKLEKLNENTIRTEIKSIFPDFEVTKLIGRQDGPDFNLYEIAYSGENIFYISMDSYDTTLVQDLRTKSKSIKDKYGISVGQKIEYALKNRPTLQFHSDLHYNIFATEENSKIEYRLKGNFKMLNDSSFVSNNYSVEKWQIEGMEIEYLIWRK